MAEPPVNSIDISGLTMALFAFLMLPAFCIYYPSQLPRKSVLTLQVQVLLVYAIVTVQWYLCGESLAFSPSGGRIYGNFENAGLRNVLTTEVNKDGTHPLVSYVQNTLFACASVAWVTIATAERGRLSTSLLFALLWTGLAYVPVACWMWGPNGWLARLGAIDHAGAICLHACSGSSSAVYSAMLGPRLPEEDVRSRPQTASTNETLGRRETSETRETTRTMSKLADLPCGTFFFLIAKIGMVCCRLPPTIRLVIAFCSTMIAAWMGALTWSIVRYGKTKRWSLRAISAGMVSGLIAISSGAGYVPMWAAFVYGIAAGLACSSAQRLKIMWKLDDVFDGIALHVVGGLVGSVLTALLVNDDIVQADGFTPPLQMKLGRRLGIQLVAFIVPTLFSALVTYLILLLLVLLHQKNWLKMGIRIDDIEERLGWDETTTGELGVDYPDLVWALFQGDLVRRERPSNGRRMSRLREDIEVVAE